jgi:hypothetical protein
MNLDRSVANVKYTAPSQALASRGLAALGSLFGERRLSLQFSFAALMSGVCGVSFVYLQTLLSVGAQVGLYAKYGAIFGASLAALLIAVVRGARAGGVAFLLISLASCALEPMRIRTYPIVFVLATPGLAFAWVSIPATRWFLKRAHASRHALAWLTGIVAMPALGLGLCDEFVHLALGVEPRLSAFFLSLGFAAALTANVLISAGLLVAGGVMLAQATLRRAL